MAEQERRLDGTHHPVVVIGGGQATGPYQVPRVPRTAERLPDAVTQLHSSDYRNPEQLHRRDGGRDIDLRRFALEGMQLHGRLLGIAHGRVRFAADLRSNLDGAGGRGYPTHERGVTSRPGLYLLGLPWQYTWGSGRFSGVAADAEHLLGRIVELRRRGAAADGLLRLAGTPTSTFPEAARKDMGLADEDRVAPHAVA
ncbi:hypothetical protein GCM10023215_64040 [Pseudonocardia yuanmonensis]|uniref:Uncharacterized protein n=1 Tax=Pseudonocardia yuanmonensis TaxID=1095914 RepID=A0ABP8XPM6_9PSEU